MNIRTSISIELIKLRRSGNFIILALLLLLLFLTASLMFRISTSESGHDNGSIYSVAATQAIGLVRFFLTLFIMMNIGKEFTERTLRKSIIDGVTRDEFFIGKILLLITSSFFAFFLLELVFFIQGLISGHASEAASLFELSFLVTSFMKIFLAGVLGFFLIWVTQGLAASVIIYFAWGIVEALFIKLLQLYTGVNVGLENYLPLSSIEKLFNTNEQLQSYQFALPMIYVFLMLFVPYYLLMKKDIR